MVNDRKGKSGEKYTYADIYKIFNKYGYTILTSEEEYVNTHTKVDTVTPNGYSYSCTPDKFLQGRRCPRENKQYFGETYVGEVLDVCIKDNMNIMYQYKLDIKGKDVVIDYLILTDNVPSIIVEYNGKQHYEPINYFGGVEKFTKQVERDRLVNQYCIDAGLKYIEIPYTYKPDDIKRELFTLFDYTGNYNIEIKVDIQHKVYDEIVDYYNTHTLKETMEKFNISKTTFWRYVDKSNIKPVKKTVPTFDVEEALKLYRKIGAKETAKVYGVSAGTIRRYVRKERAETANQST